MGLPPVGPGSPNLNDLLQLGGIPTPGRSGAAAFSTALAASQDQIAGLLQLLATPDITQLLSTVEQRLPPPNPALTQQLLQAASSAATAGDVPLALVKVQELLTVNPQLAEALPNEPTLQPIQREVVNLVRQLISEARTQAEDTMATATQAVASGVPKKAQASEVDLHTVLLLATRFIDSGRLIDYLVATDLARVVIARYASPPPSATAANASTPDPSAPNLAPPNVNAAKVLTTPTLLQVLARPEIAALISNIGQRLLVQHPALMEELLHTVTATDIVRDLPRALAKMPEIIELVTNLDIFVSPPQSPALKQELLLAASAAAATGDVPQALAKVKELVTMNPQQAETVAANSALRAIQPEVLNLIRQLTSQARTQAQERVATAAQAIATGGLKKIEGSQADVRTLLSIASYLFESGRLPDYLLAIELAQIVIARYGKLRGKKPVRWAANFTRPKSEPMRARFERWWMRVPLLILLLAWLGLGLVFGIGSLIVRKVRPDSFDPSIAALAFDIWGVGFLALVGFGFYMRIRNVRF